MVRFYRVLFVVAFLACPVPHAEANLITNGDFESGDVGFTTELTRRIGDIVPASSFDIVANPSLVHFAAADYGDNTTGSGNMMAINGSLQAGRTIWSQVVNVAPNRRYEFSLWSSTWFARGGLAVRINGETLGGTVFTPDATAVWEQARRGWSSGGATTASIELVNVTTLFGADDFALDDLALFEVLAGDYNGDGFVSQGDLDLVLLNWGNNSDQDADGVPAGWFNDLPDGQIGQAELDAVLLNWGGGVPLANLSTVPEPSTAVLLLVTGFVLRRGRFRK